MNVPKMLPKLALLWLLALGMDAVALEPIPDQLVVLTFDDSVSSQHSIVRPLLKRYGFGATFFITEGFSFRTNKQDFQFRGVPVEGVIVDAATQAPLPTRLSIRGPDGTWYFPKSSSAAGSAVRYERRNGGNTHAVEMHTVLSAHPFRLESG